MFRQLCRFTLVFSALWLLSGCGGGKGVQEPDTFEPAPTTPAKRGSTLEP